MLIIRDDDTSYWTSPKELESVYGKHLERGIKISLAVVPNSFKLYHKGDRTQLFLSEERRVVSDNKELVDYLLPYVRSGQIEIMQHGFDHSYAIPWGQGTVILSKEIRDEVGQTSNLRFLPECIYKSDELIAKEFSDGKRILEDTFGIKIVSFVPPSNALRPTVVKTIENLGMNISGTMTNKLNREKDAYGLWNYLKKGVWHIRHKGISYPYVMKYRKHQELTSHAFTPITNMKKYENEYSYIIEHGCDFTLATHYWEILECESLRQEFDDFLLRHADRNNTMCHKKAFEI